MAPSFVRIAAPATSANLGPGFDAAGLALDWWDTLEVTVRPGAPSFNATGMQAEQLRGGGDNLVLASMRALAGAVGADLPGVHLELVKGFPLGRGFGSSAAAIALGLLAARELVAPELPDEAVIDFAAKVEGHPDNVVPCLLGGATLALVDGSGHVTVHRAEPHPGLAAVVLVAASPLSTEAARRALPAEVPFALAARTAGRAALLLPAITGAFDLLMQATDDQLHQPVRLALDKVAGAALAGLRAAGHAAVLSGAGPSLLVLTPAGATGAVLACASELLAGAEGWVAREVGLAPTGALGTVERTEP
jgi:homoserine kinase